MKTFVRSALASMLVSALGLFLLAPVISLAGGLFFIDDATGFMGLGNTTPSSRLDVSGTIYSRQVTATSSAIDWNAGNVQQLTLTSNSTLSFTNGHAGGEYKLIIKQDATAGHTVTWPSSVIWAGGNTPAITAYASSTDVISFVYDGSKYLGSYLLNYGGLTDTVSFDSSSNEFNSGGGTHSSVTGNTQTVSGSNPIVLIGVWASQNLANLSCTFNGATATIIDHTVLSGTENMWVYGILNPTTGLAIAPVCTFNSISASVVIQSFSYKGVKQSSLPDTHAVHTGSSATSFTSTLTTTADNSWVFLWGRNLSSTFTAGTGSTFRNQMADEALTGADSNGPVHPAGTYSMSMSWSPSSTWGNIMVELAPAQ